MKKLNLLIYILLFWGIGIAKAQYTVIHNFNDTNGSGPRGTLTLLGSTFYGTTYFGGGSEEGNLFSMHMDGSGYKELWYFNDTDGAFPYNSLTPSITGDTLFGMTYTGGIDENGVLFCIDTNGTGYTVLLYFSGGDSGSGGSGSLILSASGKVLYGMTQFGGGSYGNIFSINTNGSGYNDLWDFSYSTGVLPRASLTLGGNKLYGMTEQGGAHLDGGVIFSIDTDGSGYDTLMSFNGANGFMPDNSLILLGNKLYGMTVDGGGLTGDGNIFSINTDGTGFQNLFDFNGANGAAPFGDLTFYEGVLYGMTAEAGANGDGNIFLINTDGSGFTDLLDFNGINGAIPFGDVTFSGCRLYGMTSEGGTNGYGVIFDLGIPVVKISNITNVAYYAGSTGNATATAAGGASPYAYSWSNAQTIATATGLSAGSYTVTVTDANGCTSSASATITQPSLRSALHKLIPPTSSNCNCK